jgi:hypothetical protein
MVHEYDPVGGLAREAQLVGDDQHGHPAFGEVAHHGEDFADQFGIECGSRLVEQHDFGPHGEGAGDRHALLLAAGQFDRIGIALVREAHAREQGFGVADRFLARTLEDRDRAFDQVLDRRQMLEQVEALERDLGVGKLVKRVADAPETGELAVDEHRARIGRFELVHATQQGRLARARRTDHAHDFARCYVQRHAVQSRERAEELAHVANGEERGGHRTSLAGAVGRLALRSPRPLEKCRSRKYWPICSTVTTARYQIAATIRSSIVRALA